MAQVMTCVAGLADCAVGDNNPCGTYNDEFGDPGERTWLTVLGFIIMAAMAFVRFILFIF